MYFIDVKKVVFHKKVSGFLGTFDSCLGTGQLHSICVIRLVLELSSAYRSAFFKRN